MNRYRRARALGAEVFQEQLAEDKALLASFGLRLLDVSGGVTVAFEQELRGERVNPWNCATIDSKVFEWMQPLLSELVRRRAGEGSSTA